MLQRKAKVVATPGTAMVNQSFEDSSTDNCQDTDDCPPDTGPTEDFPPDAGPTNSKRPSTYKTKTRKKLEKKQLATDRAQAYENAAQAWLEGKFSSLPKCAFRNGLAYSTLHKLVTNPEKSFKGKGRKSPCLFPEEEKKIVDHVTWRASVGAGATWNQLQMLIQVSFQIDTCGGIILKLLDKSELFDRIMSIGVVGVYPCIDW